jgi:hypothetical protein
MKLGITFVATVALMATGSATAAGQRIEPDATKWIKYEVNYGEGNVWLSVPSNHRFKDLPHKLSRPFVSR